MNLARPLGYHSGLRSRPEGVMRVLLVVGLIAVAGCWRNQMERPPLGVPSGGVTPAGSGAGSNVRELPLALKTVTSKEPPTMLVAFDGSTCLVTEKRYRETVVGEKAWCVWMFRR